MRSERRLVVLWAGFWAWAAPGAVAQFPPVLDLLELTAEDGIVFLAEPPPLGDSTGLTYAPAQAADLNDDGFPDVVLSAPRDALVGLPGTVYVVFGGPALLGRDVIDLAALGAPRGFIIEGPSPESFFGNVFVAGPDFNADGIDDLAVGARLGEPPGGDTNGQVFVIFGHAGIGADGTFDLAALDGSNGFVINGKNRFDYLGTDNTLPTPMPALDFNADGYVDLAVLASAADAPGRPDIGQAYVVFGGPNMGAGGVLSPADLDGTNGITINGLLPGHRLGHMVVGGDVNHDGLDDLVFGFPGRDFLGRPDAGTTHVLFGGTPPGPGGIIELSDPPPHSGYVIVGPWEGALAGSPQRLGDVNADGMDDIVIQAAGGWWLAYVVFGGPDVGASGLFDLADLDETNGFVVHGRLTEPLGDINDDGVADFGTYDYDPPGRLGAGINYIAYGRQGVGADGEFTFAQEPDPEEGFVIWGAHDFDDTRVQEGLPDINGDGVAEFTLASRTLRRPDGTWAGGQYVIFGRSRFALGDLDRDGDVDNADFGSFVLCYNGSSRPPGPACPEGLDADLDNDGDVDLDEFSILAANYTGSQ